MKIYKLQTNWNQSYGHRGLCLPSFSLAFHTETNLCQGGVLLIFLISPPSSCLWKLQGLFLPSLPHTLLKMPTGPSLLGSGIFTCFHAYYFCPILVGKLPCFPSVRFIVRYVGDLFLKILNPIK